MFCTVQALTLSQALNRRFRTLLVSFYIKSHILSAVNVTDLNFYDPHKIAGLSSHDYVVSIYLK